MITADSIYVDNDEGRYFLDVWTEDNQRLKIDIHDIVFKFYASVQAELRPYVLEAEDARASIPSSIERQQDGSFGREWAQDTGYALDDPKHPTYHDRMVGDV